jgi:peptide/nickel transport system substrate-binding protein
MRGQHLRLVAAAALFLTAMSGGGADAQKPGGILRIYHRDGPASMSIHEEGTNSVSIPMMAVRAQILKLLLNHPRPDT